MHRTRLEFQLAGSHDRLYEESEKIINFLERENDKTSKVSQNIVITAGFRPPAKFLVCFAHD